MQDTSMLITGIGVISAAGNNVAETLSILRAGNEECGTGDAISHGLEISGL